MEATESDLRCVPVTIKPVGPEIQKDIYLVATIACPQMGLPEAFLLFAPRANELTLAAPCGCRVGVSLTSLIAELSKSIPGHAHGGVH